MPPPPATHRSESWDPIASAWGGIPGAVALMVAADRGWFLSGLVLLAGFGLGGFLAGVRASTRRLPHAAGAWLAAHLLYAAFVVLTHVVGWVGGPDSPDLLPGGGHSWLVAAAWALICALVGGGLAQRWLGADRGRLY